MKVFLGGTVANSKWRDYIMPKLKIDYFNPVVAEWTKEDQEREIIERENCEFCLYVISPKMIGWYSLAEVIDDSYKKSDKTIYCFLPKDDDNEFTKEQIKELECIGKVARANGAIWKQSLEEVIDFLNSANELTNDALLQQTDQINNVFISYGRRHSLAFARKLYKNLIDRNYDVWFDMNDIPLGVDFQEQIDDGIRKADNFIYIMSPHSINSVYCYKELVLALKYNKRIIPILHVEPQDDATWGKIAPEAGKRNWIYCRQNHDTALELSAKTFQIQEKILNIPEEKWNITDDFKIAFENLITLIDNHRAYVRTHTVLLDKSLDWTKNSRTTQKLLVGKERQEAIRFLRRSHQIFKNPTGHLIQPPCEPTDLLAEFIMESKKNGNNMQSDLFICHDVDDAKTVTKITSTLAKYNFSAWLHSKDISKGVEYNHAIHNGIVQSANMLFFISKKSLNSDYCKKEYKLAIKYNKRIIPVLIDLDSLESFKKANENFEGLQELQYINFTDLTNEINVEIKDHSDVKADVESRREKTPFEISIDEIVHTLDDERTYFEEHRVFLVQALRWKEQGQKQSYLLRGFNYENAKTWLRLYKKREQHAPLNIHKDFIQASEAAKGQLGTDVFISYSRKDSDIARQLNRKLQSAEKTTWFDQESISKGVDFEKEIFKGINGCDNFVFVISPDAIASEYCEREVNYAVSQNKRIITLLARDTDPETMPEALRIINWIDFKNSDFSESFADLVQAIELDREHAAMHTSTQQRANEWNIQEQSPDFLLNITACKNIEKWLSDAYNTDIKTIFEKPAQLECKKTPTPTLLQINYTKKSREKIVATVAKEQKKQRRIIGIVSIAAIISIIFGIFGFVNMKKAQKNEKKTKELVITGYLRDAQAYVDKEEYEVALQKYEYLRDSLDSNTPAVQKRIEKCKHLDSLNRIFYKNIIIADSLLKTQKVENLIKTDSLYEVIIALKYKPGDKYLEPILEIYNDVRATIIFVNIDRAKKYMEVPGKALYPIAKDLLINLQKLEPDNKEIKKLLNKM